MRGGNFDLLDNALRQFKLNSVANEWDSLVRIWVLQSEFPDTSNTWRIKMFEFGKTEKVPVATMHVLELQPDSDSFQIKCVKQLRMSPNKGWLAFEKDIRALNLTAFYEKRLDESHVIQDFGMLTLQFLFGHTTHSVDLTAMDFYMTEVSNRTTAPIPDHLKRLAYLMWYLEKHFSIRLTVNPKGSDFLEYVMKRLNFRRQ